MVPKVLKQTNGMDYNKRFDQIESILTDVLKVQDRLVADHERWEEHERRITRIEQKLSIEGE